MDEKPGLFRSWKQAIIALLLVLGLIALVGLAIYLTVRAL